MANVVGRDILVRMLGDVDELKRSQAVMGQAISELRLFESRAVAAIEGTQTALAVTQGAVAELHTSLRNVEASQRELSAIYRPRQDILRVIAEQVENGQRLFSKLQGSIEALIETAGDVEARVDALDERVTALEAKRGS